MSITLTFDLLALLFAVTTFFTVFSVLLSDSDEIGWAIPALAGAAFVYFATVGFFSIY